MQNLSNYLLAQRPQPIMMKSNRGYTIIVVMLILILLSGLGIIALNSVSVGVREASLQKMHQQAFDTSNSAMLLFSEYAGANAPLLFGKYKTDFEKNRPTSSAGQANASSNWALHIPEKEMLNMVFNATGSNSLFANGPAQQTWEKNRNVSYDIVMRDLTDGITAPGYSDAFCFRRVLIGGESRVGHSATAGDNGTVFANAITAQETLIGPIRCNN